MRNKHEGLKIRFGKLTVDLCPGPLTVAALYALAIITVSVAVLTITLRLTSR